MSAPTAPVAADDVVGVVGTYADRLHDALLRLDVPARQAPEVVRRSAERLVTAVGAAQAREPLGWWWGDALAEGGTLSGAGPHPRRRRREAAENAFTAVPAPQRFPLLLRDAYDLPLASVATAMALPVEEVAELVLAGRRAIAAAHDAAPAAPWPAHGRAEGPTASSLVGLADGTLPSADAARVRQHLRSCGSCARSVDLAHSGRRLAAALPIRPLPEAARTSLLAGVGAAAASALPVPTVPRPTHEETPVPLARRPSVPYVVVLLALLAAVAAGVLAGALSARRGGQAAPLRPSAAAGPGESASATPAAASTAAAPAPASPAATAPGRPVSRPSAAPSPTPSKPPVTRPTRPSTPPPTPRPVVVPTRPPAAGTLALDPSTGPADSTVTVTGSRWTPGSTVSVEYDDTLGQPQSSATVVVPPSGRFVAQVVAHDPLAVPGRHVVVASDGRSRATAYFDAR